MGPKDEIKHKKPLEVLAELEAIVSGCKEACFWTSPSVFSRSRKSCNSPGYVEAVKDLKDYLVEMGLKNVDVLDYLIPDDSDKE